MKSSAEIYWHNGVVQIVRSQRWRVGNYKPGVRSVLRLNKILMRYKFEAKLLIGGVKLYCDKTE